MQYIVKFKDGVHTRTAIIEAHGKYKALKYFNKHHNKSQKLLSLREGK